MTNPCFGFGQIHTNNATLVGVTSRCGAGDHIGFTPPLPHRSSPTCICIQPTIHIFCIFVLVILCFLSSRKQELTNLYLYSTHYSAILFFYFDNLALNDQKLPTTCMISAKKWRKSEWRKFLKHSCYILVAIERGEKVFETHSFGVICNKKRGESFL